MATVFETMPGGYSDGYPAPTQRYYPGTYMEERPSYAERRGYRMYAGKDYRRDGFDYVTTKEPFQPDHDYYHKEYKRPYYYRDNRLYHAKDPVRKYYDGSGNVTVTVIDGGQPKDKEDGRYSRRDEPQSSARAQFYPKEHREKHMEQEELEVGYLVEHLASFDVGEDHDPSHAGQNIESAIETLRNMDQDQAILPLRCYLTYKDEEIQVLSDKELTVLEWIKYDDVNLVSAEVHQLTQYEEILLVQVKEVIHLFCPLGDLSAEELARNIKERISKRRDRLDEKRGSRWEEDRSNNRFVLNDETIKEEADVDFYDKYTMQLYGRAKRDYVARNDKELTVMSGERVEIQSTRGQWWLCHLSNGKSGYVPSDCLESYVPSPAGLPRTTLGDRDRRGRDMDSVSEHGSVYSAAPSRHRDGGRDYHDGRRDHRRDDRRGYDRDRPRDNFDTRSFAGRQGFSGTNFANRGLSSGFGTGLGAGLSSGFGTGMNGLGAAGLSAGLTGNALGNGFGTIGPSSIAGLGAGLSSGLGTGMNGLGTIGLAGNGLGNGLGTIGPSSGFSTVSSATAAGLFPQGFTAQLQGRPMPMTGSVRGNPLLGAQQLGTPALGLGTPTLGVPAFGNPALGLGTPTLGVPILGVPRLGVPRMGAPSVRPTLGIPGQGGFRLM